MRVRQSRTRSPDHDHAQAKLLGGATAEHRKLPAAAGCAVAPQHRGPRGVAELGEAKAPAGGQVEATLGARLFDAKYMHGVSHRVGHPYLSREAESSHIGA